MIARVTLLVVLLLAICGVARLLTISPRSGASENYDLSLITGTALLIVMTGYFLLFGFACPIYLGVLIVGFGFFALLSPRTLPPIVKNRLGTAVLVSATILIAAFFLALPPSFNSNDDAPGYYTFVREIADSGFLSEQPFSERRLYTLGGHLPLMSLTDSLFGTQGATIIEPGLGIALIGLIVVGCYARGRLPLLFALATLIGCALQLAINSPIKNTIPVLLPTTFILAMLLAIIRSGSGRQPQVTALSFGTLAGGAILYRVTVIPYVAVLLILYLHFFDSWPERFRAAVKLAFGAMFALLPFALLMYQSSGTLLFPVLGTGVHETAFRKGSFVDGLSFLQLFAVAAHVVTSPYVVLSLVLLSLRSLVKERRGTLTRCILVTSGFLLSSLSVAFSTQAVAFERYAFPGIAALVICFVLTMPWLELAPRWPTWLSHRVPGRPALLTACCLLASVMIAVGVSQATKLVAFAEAKLQTRYKSMSSSEELLKSYRAVSEQIPSGAKVLVTLQYAYMLPRGHFHILVNDQPGRSGPSPFWPKTWNSASVYHYLVDNGINFILLDGWLSKPSSCRFENETTQWMKRLSETSCSFSEAITDIPFASRVIYRDGNVLLIDLNHSEQSFQ